MVQRPFLKLNAHFSTPKVSHRSDQSAMPSTQTIHKHLLRVPSARPLPIKPPSHRKRGPGPLPKRVVRARAGRVVSTFAIKALPQAVCRDAVMHKRIIRARPGVAVPGALRRPRPQAEARPALAELRIVRARTGVLPGPRIRQPRCNALGRRTALRVVRVERVCPWTGDAVFRHQGVQACGERVARAFPWRFRGVRPGTWLSRCVLACYSQPRGDGVDRRLIEFELVLDAVGAWAWVVVEVVCHSGCVLQLI